MINVKKLDWELRLANIPIFGCNSKGDIWFLPEATLEQRTIALEILAKHKPAWYVEERRKRYPPVGDQLDAIYKFFKDQNIQVSGFTDLIDKVKADFPKE